jgi:hypothetical protein
MVGRSRREARVEGQREGIGGVEEEVKDEEKEG